MSCKKGVQVEWWGRKPDSRGMRNKNRPEMLTAYVLAVKRTRDGGGERCDHKAERELVQD